MPTIKRTSKIRKYQKYPVLDVACDLVLVVGHWRSHIVTVQLGEVSPVEQRDLVLGLHHPDILPAEGVRFLDRASKEPSHRFHNHG